MRCELWLYLRCCAESGVIQYVEIFPHGAWRFSWINGAAVPIFLWCRVLFVRVRLDQTGVDCKPLAAYQTIRNAMRDGLLKQVAQQGTLTETPVSVL